MSQAETMAIVAPSGTLARAAAGATRILDFAFGFATTACLIAMIVVVAAGVVARYIANTSLAWGEEVAIWLFLFIIFFGLPLAISRGMTLKLGGLEGWLGGVGKQILRFANDAVVAYVLVLLVMGAEVVVRRVGGVTPVLAMPMWLPYGVLVVAAIGALAMLALRVEADGTLSPRALAGIALALIVWAVFHQWELAYLPEANPSIIAFVAFLVTLFMGVPVAYAMLFGVFLARLFGAPVPEAGIVQQLVTGSSKFLLLAIPFFLAAGALMNIGGLTTRIIDFASKLVGHLRGGLGQVNVVTATLFSGISGSSISEAAITTKLLADDMVKNGYPRPVACAMIAAASVLPNIIPPSIALLLLAAAVNLSVGDVWMAGVLPGLVLGASLMIVTYLMARWNGYGGQAARAPLSAIGTAGLRALPILLLILIILGGIRFGIVTPTESGVLAVLYALFLGLVVYRGYGVREMLSHLSHSAVEVAMVGLLIGAAGPFAFIFIADRVPQEIVAFTSALIDSKLMLLLLVNLVLLFFGMILDIGVAILVLTPMLMPLAIKFGIDPVHFGIVIAVNLMLGGLTPPVGMLVYVSASVAGTPAEKVFRAVWPFLAAMLAALVLISVWPALSLALIR